MNTNLCKSSAVISMLAIAMLAAGCLTAREHREKADKTAYALVNETRASVLTNSLGKFDIEPPSVTLRRRLTSMQDLPAYGRQTLGAEYLDKPKHWPKGVEPGAGGNSNSVKVVWGSDKTINLTLIDAIKIAARNSPDYQVAKESVFSKALQLDLEQNNFRSTFSGVLESGVDRNTRNEYGYTGNKNSAKTGIVKKFENGASVSGLLAMDLVKLLTGDRSSAWGLSADATVSIPLLRGAGKYIAREPLTQAERNLVYAIYDFEEFKRGFAVDIEKSFLRVMQTSDQSKNAQWNYETLTRATTRAETMAEAGRLPGFQVDQAKQDQLRSYNRLIRARQEEVAALDNFKMLLGLPPDAAIELNRDSFEKLTREAEVRARNRVLSTSARSYIIRALENRLDMRTASDKVYDAQRAVVIAADNLRSEVTLLGKASTGGSQSISSADGSNINLDASKGLLSGLLTIDLAIERTAERDAFRQRLIDLQQAIREAQHKEDSIKIQVRDDLRNIEASGKEITSQIKAVRLAEERQKSTALFLKAGRAEMRDLLDAQEALLSVRNALTAAIIKYRIAELTLQSDMGILQVTDSGLVTETKLGKQAGRASARKNKSSSLTAGGAGAKPGVHTLGKDT